MPRALSRLTWSLCDSLAVTHPRSLSIGNRHGCRYVQIKATAIPDTEAIDSAQNDPLDPSSPDAQFEVLGAPQSLLSVQLSASQNFYTQRGSLAALSGKLENAVSTLSMLQPFQRSALGIPFLYQRVTSTTPLTALVASKSPITSFAVIHLDGRIDWVVAQRTALLAWTGHTLKIKPKANFRLGAAHWGNSHVTGRGLVALVGKGQIYQIQLKAGEEYVVHPSHVVAYSINQIPPLPYRFKSTTLNFQIPSTSLGALVPDVKFFKSISETETWKVLASALFTIRTWARRSIFGDRLFLRFQGPSTILLQSRGSRLTDSLTTKDVNEIADSPAGAVQSAVKLDLTKTAQPESTNTVAKPKITEPKMTYAKVGDDGKVKFENN